MKIDFNKIKTGEVGAFLDALHPLVESNKESLLIQLLTCFGSCVGRKSYFSAAADKHFTNIFTVILGKSAKGRKGMSLNIIKDLFSSADPIWSSNHILKGLSSGEGLVYHFQDKIQKDITGVDINIGAIDKRLLCIATEFSAILKMTQRDGNVLSQILRDCWDSQDLEIRTKNDPMKCTDPMVSMIGHITEVELVKYLTPTEIANGFANRCIFIKAQNDKRLPNAEPLDTEVRNYLSTVIKANLEKAQTVEKMNFDSDAKKYWEQLYYSIPGDDASVMGSLTARQEPQIRRLAMIIALFNGKNFIDLDSLIFAEKIYEYSIATLKEIYGDSLGSPVADKILDLLKSSPDGSSRSDISKHLSNNTSKFIIDNSLNLLRSQGLADCKKAHTSGRSQEVWFFVNKDCLVLTKDYELNEESPLISLNS